LPAGTALDRASRRAAELGVDDRVELQQHDLARTFPDGESAAVFDNVIATRRLGVYAST